MQCCIKHANEGAEESIFQLRMSESDKELSSLGSGAIFQYIGQ